MLRKVTLSGLFAIAQMVGLAGVAVAQTTIINTTNACINSTYIFSSPMGAPVSITIDRRVTFNPLANCTTPAMNSAGCTRDGPAMYLIAMAMGAQITMNPSCSWNCVGCGTIITNGALNGLPVELLDFSVDDAEEGEEDLRPDAPASEQTDDGAGSTSN